MVGMSQEAAVKDGRHPCELRGSCRNFHPSASSARVPRALKKRRARARYFSRLNPPSEPLSFRRVASLRQRTIEIKIDGIVPRCRSDFSKRDEPRSTAQARARLSLRCLRLVKDVQRGASHCHVSQRRPTTSSTSTRDALTIVRSDRATRSRKRARHPRTDRKIVTPIRSPNDRAARFPRHSEPRIARNTRKEPKKRAPRNPGLRNVHEETCQGRRSEGKDSILGFRRRLEGTNAWKADDISSRRYIIDRTRSS